jgi:hypothetical protein
MGCLRACFNRLLSLIFLMAILGILVYLFWSYPPWFQHLIESLKKVFSSGGT